MTEEKKPEVVFVNSNGILCPFRQVDYKTLNASGLRVFKIAMTHLPMLKTGMLKGHTIQVVEWEDIYRKVINFAVKDVTGVSIQVAKVEGEHRMRAVYAFSKEQRTIVTQVMNRLSQYFGRYCFQIRELEWKNRDQPRKKALTSAPEGADGDRIECHYRIVFNRDIDPSRHYNEVLDTTPQKEVILELSRFSRMRLLKVMSPITVGVHSMCVIFEDKNGTEWVESFRRTFEVPNMKTEQLSDAAGFLLNLALSKN